MAKSASTLPRSISSSQSPFCSASFPRRSRWSPATLSSRELPPESPSSLPATVSKSRSPALACSPTSYRPNKRQMRLTRDVVFLSATGFNPEHHKKRYTVAVEGQPQSHHPRGGIMPQNLLEHLRKYTVVVADTGDMEAMEKFHPRDATTNPSLITAAAQMPHYQPIVDGVLMDAHKELGDSATDQQVANLA